MPSDKALVVTLDLGSSSVRTLVFDEAGQHLGGVGVQIPYEVETTPEGGVQLDPSQLVDLCDRALSAVHDQLKRAGRKPAAVGFSTFWHSLVGVGANGDPTTPLIHLFDTRSDAEARQLASRVDGGAVHARTGCRLHSSYWPAKLCWISKTNLDGFARTKLWLSPGAYLFQKFLGKPGESTSMASATGLWDQRANRYDAEMLNLAGVSESSLMPTDQLDREQSELSPLYRTRWPLFHGIPWYPALGDGACNNIGSGCVSPDHFSLMVGTSGAMRAVVEADAIEIPDGLWCYRVDRRRYILGGALSNGGDVYAWMRHTLLLPPEQAIEAALAQARPGSHGLLCLPFFAGERSPYWRADLRASITGISLATTATDILRAALESVSLRFGVIYRLMVQSLGSPVQVIGSGGALMHSAAWMGMMSDALGSRVLLCVEPEATSRGVAIAALERLGHIASIADLPVQTGRIADPRPEFVAIYADMLGKQEHLFNKLYLEAS